MGFELVLECRVKSRITLSIKQLEEDPLLETLDKVIPQVCKGDNIFCYALWQIIFLLHRTKSSDVSHLLQDGSTGPDSLRTSDSYDIEPLPGLETIFEELLQEEGYDLIIARLVKNSCWDFRDTFVTFVYFLLLCSSLYIL